MPCCCCAFSYNFPSTFCSTLGFLEYVISCVTVKAYESQCSNTRVLELNKMLNQCPSAPSPVGKSSNARPSLLSKFNISSLIVKSS